MFDILHRFLPKSSNPQEKGDVMSKPKPTRVVIHYRDVNREPESYECLYAKAREGFFTIAMQEGSSYRFKNIPSGNPDIECIEVFSEKSHSRDEDHDH
jgi:hypothetical protein